MIHPEHNPEIAEWISKLIQIEVPDPLYPNLKDGIILCKLIDHINSTNFKPEKTTNLFQRNINITYFINGCTQAGVKSTELFDTNDMNSDRFLYVERCLLSLSRNAFSKELIKICVGPQLSANETFHYDKNLIHKKRVEGLKDRGIHFGDYFAQEGVRRQITQQESKESSDTEKKEME